MSLTQVSNQVIQYPYRKNFLINGCMRVSQRGASLALTGSAAYLADRWKVFATGSGLSGNQQTGPWGGVASGKGLFVDSVSWTSGSANFLTRIESKDAIYLVNKTVTIAATIWHNFGVSVNMGFLLSKANGVDNFSAVTTEYTSSPLAAPNNAVTRIKATATLGDVSNGLQVAIRMTDAISVASGSLGITEVQLELGSVATPFEYRPFAEELVLCQRYYEKSYDLGVAPGTSTVVGEVVLVGCGAAAYPMIDFKVTKRIAPTACKLYSTVTGAVDNVRNLTTAGDVGATSLVASGQQSFFGALISTDLQIYAYHWTADAEL